jgi:hypothetical protein
MSLTVDGFWKVGFWDAGFWADGFWQEGGVTSTPAPTQTENPAGRSRRTRILARIDGKERYFDTWEDLEEYLEGLKEEVVEQAVAKTNYTVIAPGKLLPPKIRIRAEPEVVQLVARVNDEIRERYMIALAVELKRRDEEEEAMLLL